MKPQNLLFYSQISIPEGLRMLRPPLVKTPYLDQLASEGTLLKMLTAILNLCACKRALATGRYVFETGYWDNVKAYEDLCLLGIIG